MEEVAGSLKGREGRQSLTDKVGEMSMDRRGDPERWCLEKEELGEGGEEQGVGKIENYTITL